MRSRAAREHQTRTDGVVALIGPSNGVMRSLEQALATRYVIEYHRTPTALLQHLQHTELTARTRQRLYVFSLVGTQGSSRRPARPSRGGAAEAHQRGHSTTLCRWLAQLRELDHQVPEQPILVAADERKQGPLIEAALQAGADDWISLSAVFHTELVLHRVRSVLESFAKDFPTPDAEQRERLTRVDAAAIRGVGTVAPAVRTPTKLGRDMTDAGTTARGRGERRHGERRQAVVGEVDAARTGSAVPMAEDEGWDEPLSAAEVDAAVARVREAAAALPAVEERSAQLSDLLQVHAPDLRNPTTGRLDAKRIADALHISLRKLAAATPVTPQALSETLDSPRAQAALDPFARVLGAMELYMSANLEFNQSQPLMREYVRSYYLYVDPRPEVSARGVVDVPAMLERATGLPAETVWNALYALHASWASRSRADIEAGRIATNRGDYLSTLSGLSADERARWFKLAVWEAVDLQARIRRCYSVTEPRYWDVLPFEERPLIAFGDLMFCSSVPLLQRLHGASLQHRLQDRDVFSEQETRRFRDTLGHLVEHYTAATFSRAFGSRFIPEGILKACAGDASVCDGIIVYPDALILIECKAASPLLGTRHAEHYEPYRQQWRRHLRKAAGQITSTLDLLRHGAFSSLGLARDGAWELYPVVCVFEQTVQPLAYRSVRTVDLADHPLSARMAAGTVKPLQLLHIKEVEMLEGAVEQGRSVLELLREKTANDESAALPFQHFVHLTGEMFQRTHPKWHVAQWRRITDKATQHFRSLGLGARS